MATSYDPSLATAKDWVRVLIGDRAEPFALTDEEIGAILTEHSQNKYLAAAACGKVIVAKGRDVVSKSVGDLSISYGGSAESAYGTHLENLRAKGVDENLRNGGKSPVLRVL